MAQLLSCKRSSHKVAICDLEAQGPRMVSAFEEGNIILWQSGGHFTEIIKINGKGSIWLAQCVAHCGQETLSE